MDLVAESWMLEDATDPVAVSLFCNADNYEIAHDSELNNAILKGFGDEAEELFGLEDDGTVNDDYCVGCDVDTLNSDLDDEYLASVDITDEDGEIIDIVDGLM